MTETMDRYERVKSKIFSIIGHQCVLCGSSEDLQIDHIDPTQKAFNISQMWAYAFAAVETELKKCQPLCRPCHVAKHAVAKGTHGTLSARRHCACDECRAAKANYMRLYAEKKLGRKSGAQRERSPCGTRAKYRYCKCSACRAAHAAYMKALRARKRS